MYSFLKTINIIYLIVACTGGVVLPIIRPNEKEDATGYKGQKDSTESKTSKAVKDVSAAAVMGLVIALVLIVPGINIPLILLFVRLSDSLDSIRQIVTDVKSFDTGYIVSKKTCDAILIVAITLSLLQPGELIIRAIEWRAAVEDSVFVDVCFVIVVSLLLSLMVFFIVIIIFLLIKTIIIDLNLLKQKKKISTDNKKGVVRKAVGRVIGLYNNHSLLSEKNIEISKPLLNIIKVCLFIIDCIISFFSLVASICCVIIVILPSKILEHVKDFFHLISDRIYRVSEKKMISFTFRSSFIITVVMLEVMNRTGNIRYTIESGIELFEFMASAIVIPLILLWVAEVRIALRT